MARTNPSGRCHCSGCGSPAELTMTRSGQFVTAKGWVIVVTFEREGALVSIVCPRCAKEPKVVEKVIGGS